MRRVATWGGSATGARSWGASQGTAAGQKYESGHSATFSHILLTVNYAGLDPHVDVM